MSGTRPAVLTFSQAMEEKLRKKDEEYGKEGWKNDTYEELFGRFGMKTVEFAQAMHVGDEERSKELCVDIANFCMMIHDKLEGR